MCLTRLCARYSDDQRIVNERFQAKVYVPWSFNICVCREAILVDFKAIDDCSSRQAWVYQKQRSTVIGLYACAFVSSNEERSQTYVKVYKEHKSKWSSGPGS